MQQHYLTRREALLIVTMSENSFENKLVRYKKVVVSCRR